MATEKRAAKVLMEMITSSQNSEVVFANEIGLFPGYEQERLLDYINYLFFYWKNIQEFPYGTLNKPPLPSSMDLVLSMSSVIEENLMKKWENK